MVEIRKELCVGCSACVKDCLMGNIRLEEGKAEAGERCILCGHCVAVCPKGAVSLPACNMDEVEEYTAETFTVAPENYLHLVKFRRSIRQFKETPVSRETAEKILAAGRHAATAANKQGNRFIWVQEDLAEFKALLWQEIPALIPAFEEASPRMGARFREFLEVHRETGADSFFFGAPVLLAITAPDPFDGGLAAANMENMAVTCGAGILYSGYLTRIIKESPVLAEWLGLGEKDLVCCLLIGYPAVSYKRTAPRKRQEDTVWK